MGPSPHKPDEALNGPLLLRTHLQPSRPRRIGRPGGAQVPHHSIRNPSAVTPFNGQDSVDTPRLGKGHPTSCLNPGIDSGPPPTGRVPVNRWTRPVGESL